MAKTFWREQEIGKRPHDDEYIAEVVCGNGCGYMGKRWVYVKKGVLRKSIEDVKCNCCDCPAYLI